MKRLTYVIHMSQTTALEARWIKVLDAAVRQEIKLAYNASTQEIQDEFGDCDDHVNWVRYAGLFATSDEDKDECRHKWRKFISNNNL